MHARNYGKFKFPFKLVIVAAAAFAVGGGAFADAALAAPAPAAAPTSAQAPTSVHRPGAVVTNSPVYIASHNAGQRLGAAAASPSAGLRVDFHSHNVYYSWATEKWDISEDSTGDGYYVIKNNADEGMCVQPYNNSTDVTNTTILQPCDNSRAQEWAFRAYQAPYGGQTEYMITPRDRSNVALSVPYNQVAGDWGTPDLDHAYAATNQLWGLFRA